MLTAIAIAIAPTWLAWFGRDITLTRRTEIWALVFPAIAEQPWLGHGAGAFWHVELGLRDQDRELGPVRTGDEPLVAVLGVVGLVAFCVPFALALVRAVRLALDAPGAGALWPLAFLAWLVTSNLGEGALMRRGPLGWAVFVATAATLAARSRREPG